jgi:hypothetical protein
MISFRKNRWKSTRDLLRAWALRVSTPSRGVWMARETGYPPLRGVSCEGGFEGSDGF